MKNILLTILARFFASNLDGIISSLTKLDTQLDKFIARQAVVYDSASADVDAALSRAEAAVDKLNRAERIQKRIKALTA